MKKNVISIDETYYTYRQVTTSLKESESFRLNFLEEIMFAIPEMRTLRMIEDLEVVPNMQEFMHLREHFIQSAIDFYYGNPLPGEEDPEEDFNLMCKWQQLLSELFKRMNCAVDVDKEGQA